MPPHTAPIVQTVRSQSREYNDEWLINMCKVNLIRETLVEAQKQTTVNRKPIISVFK